MAISGGDERVGQELYVFGAEVVVAAVAHTVCYGDAHTFQRVDAEAFSFHEIWVAHGHGVYEVLYAGAVGEIDE